MTWQSKVALVTGGNSGIGRGIVHRFIAEGAVVVIVGRDEAKGETVVGEVRAKGGKARFRAVDLAHEGEVAGMIDSVARTEGRLDVLVNCAGVGGRRADVQPSDPPGVRWDKLRGPNLDGTYFASSYALPLLAKSRGAIVNISSTATLHGNWGLYCVAKAAVEALTRALAAEAAPHGVRVNCVSPGWIATENDGAAPPSGSASGVWQMPPSLLGRMGVPAEIASAVLFLAGSEASFVTGQTLLVDGGLAITDYTSMPMLAKLGSKLYSGMLPSQPGDQAKRAERRGTGGEGKSR